MDLAGTLEPHTDGSMQVSEEKPLDAILAIAAKLPTLQLPGVMLNAGRSMTAAHEWWGLHCTLDNTVRMCMELLPNADNLLGGSWFKDFPLNRRRPAGLYTAQRVADEPSITWPVWFQATLDQVILTGMA